MNILEAEHYRVSRARHGGEALDRVAEERPAIILLDLMMPVMDGVTFASLLRQRPMVADVPILVISADGNPQRAASVGARGYLAKPFDIDALLAHVAAITGRSGGEPRADA